MPDLKDYKEIEEAAREKLSSIRASIDNIDTYLAKPNFYKFSKSFTYVSRIMRKVRHQSESAFDPITVVCSQTDTIKAEVNNLESILEQSKTNLESILEQSNTTIESIREQSKTNLESIREQSNTTIESIREQSKTNLESIREQTNIAIESIRKIWEAKVNRRHVILLLAPFYNEIRLRDGYYRRIQAIDEIMGNECLKVYVTPVNYVLEEDFHQSFPDDSHLDLKLAFEDPEQAKLLELIASMSDLIYYHSVAFVSATTLYLDKIQILDLHGSVPEELVLQGNPEQAAIENEKEKLALENFDYAIVVSQAMATHLREKYPTTNVKYITLPILDDQITQTERYLDPKPYMDSKPYVTYVGGMQKWQMIPRMQLLIDSTHHLYNYLILVPSPCEFRHYWKDSETPPISIRSGDREAVKQVCEKAHYGLLLREDIIVNRVSCPTKLIEYLAYGVVPVLFSTSIGDFTALGMRHITLEDLESMRLPTEEERLQIVKENYVCLEKITNLYETGKSDLLAILLNV